MLLAIDAGTGSVRAVAFSQAGVQLATAAREYTHVDEPGIPGSQRFDTHLGWSLICECIQEVLAHPAVNREAIAAVSATSMREGMVLYNSHDDVLWACPNADARASTEVRELVASGEAEEIYSSGGDWVAITAPARFRWIRRNEPQIFRDTTAMGMLADWVTHRLTGEHVTDPSLGSSSGMFDLASRDWSERAVEICGLEFSVLPRVAEPGSLVGSVTKQAAGQTGLSEGTPVVVGGADTQLGLVGIGVIEGGQTTIVGGSFWQHTLVTRDVLLDPERRLRTLCHAVHGQSMVEGIGFYSGLAMRWFRDAFCADLAPANLSVYQLLEAEAAKLPPGSNGVLAFVSNLMDARNWLHAAPGFIGFDLNRPIESGRTAAFRAIQEAAAYVAAGHLAILNDLSDQSVDSLIMTGGAAQSPLWVAIVADVTGVPVRIPVVKESTALGAALFAGIGVGLYGDLSKAVASVVAFEREIEPNPSAHAAYQPEYKRWVEAYRRVLTLSADGLVEPLWKATGT